MPKKSDINHTVDNKKDPTQTHHVLDEVRNADGSFQPPHNAKKEAMGPNTKR